MGSARGSRAGFGGLAETIFPHTEHREVTWKVKLRGCSECVGRGPIFTESVWSTGRSAFLLSVLNPPLQRARSDGQAFKPAHRARALLNPCNPYHPWSFPLKIFLEPRRRDQVKARQCAAGDAREI
jgi:hypothetical protein